MANKEMSGCAKAALIVGILVAILIGAGIFVAYWWFASERQEVRGASAEQEEPWVRMEEDSGRLRLDRSKWPDFKPLEEGGKVSRDRFLAEMHDERSTELMRKHFREQADGAPVEWRLQLENVAERDRGIAAHLLLPYAVVSENGRTATHGELKVTAMFGLSKQDSLLELRRGDWVTVAGTLALEDDETRILDARVVEED